MKNITGLMLIGFLIFLTACEDDDLTQDYNVIANAGPDQTVETGSIRAIVTPTEIIEFVGGINIPGHWRGINVRSASTENEISHFILSHTGSNGFGASVSDRNRQQAIQVWGGFLKLSNGEITDGTGDGIRSHAGGVIERSDITFSAINGDNEVGF